MDVHPCMGKVAGRRILDELGIAHQTHLSRLTAAQVAAISQRCRCERG
jgi:ribosomal protein S13